MSIDEIRKRWTVGHYETTVCMYDAWNTYAEAQRDFQIVLAALDTLTAERDEALARVTRLEATLKRWWCE